MGVDVQVPPDGFQHHQPIDQDEGFRAPAPFLVLSSPHFARGHAEDAQLAVLWLRHVVPLHYHAQQLQLRPQLLPHQDPAQRGQAALA